MLRSAVREIVGREEELEALGAFVASAADRPAGLLLVGAAGAGKTTLWQAAVAAAEARGYDVLACRPSGSEIQLSFAALGDLVADRREAALAELPEPQRFALEAALRLKESRSPSDPHAIGRAFLGALRTLSRLRPVLVAVDDAQWLDASSTATLEFALRRITSEPVSLLAALRAEPARPSTAPIWDALTSGRKHEVTVGPLSVAGVHRLVRVHLGVALPRPALVRVHATSGGNPFFALELARALGPDPRLDPTGRLPVPDSLHDLIRARIAALPATVGEVMLAVASLSSPTTATLESVLPEHFATRLRRAVSAGLVRVDGDAVSFTHPLIAACVYGDALPAERRRMHRRLAKVIDDLEARARHLALGTVGADATVAAALEEAAVRARERGAPGVAAELLELAVTSTPEGTEADLRRRKLAAADAHFVAGAVEQGAALLVDLLTALPPGGERADVLAVLGWRSVDVDQALAFGGRALAAAEGDEAAQSRAHLLLGAGWPLRGMSHAIQHGREALRLAERRADPELMAEALARLAPWKMWAGQDPSGELHRALAIDAERPAARRAATRVPLALSPRLTLGLWRTYQGRLEEARDILQAFMQDAVEAGDEPTCVALHGRLADVALRAGDWSLAAVHARSAYDAADVMGFEHDGGLALYFKALVDSHAGRAAEARRAADIGAEIARTGKMQNALVMQLGVLGFLELSQGNDTGALARLRPLIDWLAEMELAFAPHPLAPYAIDALVACGEIEEARALIAQFEREARALDGPWMTAIGLRCRAQVEAADGDFAAATDALDHAIGGQAAWPFEEARSLLALGRIQRRARRKAAAKDSLERAGAIFDSLPAPLWSERTRVELARIGIRAAPGQLTEGERRVAELAGTGLTNREVASRLFMSPKTVEANLARAYRKLGIHSRAELGARLEEIRREPAQT